eukprot:36872-Pelagomonas_calceolata.AAC.3
MAVGGPHVQAYIFTPIQSHTLDKDGWKSMESQGKLRQASSPARIDVRKIMLEVCYPGTGYKGCKPQGHGTQQ